MDKIRVLLADDSGYMGMACKRILETQDHLEVVGIAADGEDAVRQARDLKPDVAVLDMRMPKLSGLAAAKQIGASRPDTGIVIMSNFDDAEYVVELLRDGRAGKAYLLKTTVEDVEELIKAVEAVAEGRTVIDPTIVQRHLGYQASIRELAGDGRKAKEGALSLMMG